MAGLGSSLRLTSPSAGPSAARIDHLNRQVADLVAQNKDAQLRIATLERNVQDERARGEQAAADVVAKWHAEREEWQDMVDFMQGAHEIAYLRTRDELHSTRIAVINEQDRVVSQRQRTLKKDFSLTLSQEKEQDLQREVARLTDELEIAKEDLQYEVAQASATEAQKLQAVRQKCAKLEEQRKQKSDELAVAVKERDKFERDLDKLKTAHAALTATLDSNKTKLERLTLKLDGAANTQAELERQNNELKLSNKDLRQQMDKWQSLETKGGAEVETLRKAKLDLETRLKDQESLLKDAEKKEVQNTKALQKEQKKVASLIVEREQLQDQLTSLEEELAQVRREAEAAKRQTRPTADTDEGRASRRKPAEAPRRRSPSPPATEVVSESEQEPEEPPPPPQTTKKRPRPEREEEEVAADKPVERPKTKKRPRQDADSDEEGQAARKRAKPRPDSKQTAAEDERPQSNKSKGKAKARASVEPEPSKPPRREKPASTSTRDKPTSTSSRQKPSSAAGGSKKPSGSSKPPKEPIAEEEDEVQEAEPERKKKRKIFLPASQPTSFPTTFEWNVPPDSGLNIPTALSPIKESAAAPKSFLRKVGSSLFGVG